MIKTNNKLSKSTKDLIFSSRYLFFIYFFDNRKVNNLNRLNCEHF